MTNDTFAPLRALRWKRPAEGPAPAAGPADVARPARGGGTLVARRRARGRAARRGAGGHPDGAGPRAGARAARAARRRHPRGGRRASRSTAGSRAVYPVLRAMEEAGRIRRGYFVDGLGAAQFALAGRGGPAAGDAGPARRAGGRARSASSSSWRRPTRPTRTAPRSPGPAATTPTGGRSSGRPAPTWRWSTARRSSTSTAAGPRSRRSRRPTIPRRSALALASLARPRRRRPGPRAGDREGRRRAGRRVAGPRRAARRRVRRRATAGMRCGPPPRRRDRAWARPSVVRSERQMPEGDTLARTAAGLRPYLVGREVVRGAGARAGTAGRPAGRLDGHRRRGDGQEPADPVRQRARGPDAPPDARLVAPLPAGRGVAPAAGSGVARARGAGLGRRLLRRPGRSSCSSSGPRRSTRRSRSWVPTCSPTRSTSTRRCAACGRPERADLTIAEALLDQRALAGIGNEVKNLVLWEAGLSPWTPAPGRRRRRAARPGRSERRGPPRSAPRRAAGRAASTAGPGARARDAGRSSRRRSYGRELPRLTYWCPPASRAPAQRRATTHRHLSGAG